MNLAFHRALGAFFGPMLQRPKRLQVAALCHRGEGAQREFLLVTSRETKRWIIPKGWPIRGLKSNEAALREAWEEAGVDQGSVVSAEPIGAYSYLKRRVNGLSVPVETLVFSVAVKALSDRYPEKSERTRMWVDADQAADLVQECELKAIFRALKD